MTCDFIDALDTMRVTKVDQCGNPIPGPNAFVTSCVASLAMNVVLDEQDDKIYRAANGNLCAVKRGCPSLLGYDIELHIQQFSPELLDILTRQPLVLSNTGAPAGVDSCNIPCNEGFALEFWATLMGQNCTTTGVQRYLYVLLPWITNAYLNDLEFGADVLDMQLNGSTRAGGQWDVGPYNVTLNGAPPGTAGPMLTPLGPTCHRRMQIVEVPPPAVSCDYVTVPTPVP
jgi:hypothetical protein